MLLPGLNAINMLLLTSCLPEYLLEINRSVNFIKKIQAITFIRF